MGDYAITNTAPGDWTVAARAGSDRAGDGTDTLVDVEVLRFVDGALVYGTAGRDRIELAAGRVLAGVGNDVIVFSGDRDEYEITVISETATRVTHTGGGGHGSDLLGHAEILRFADGDFML